MKKISRLVILCVLLALSSVEAMAQTCPSGKTAFIWVNGILTKQADWSPAVLDVGSKFLSSHPNLDRNCVVFDPVYNQSDGLFRDLLQSAYQLTLQQQDQYYGDWNSLVNNPADHDKFIAGALSFVADLNSLRSDMDAIDAAVKSWWGKGYNVVLVGHSQARGLPTKLTIGFFWIPTVRLRMACSCPIQISFRF